MVRCAARRRRSIVPPCTAFSRNHAAARRPFLHPLRPGGPGRGERAAERARHARPAARGRTRKEEKARPAGRPMGGGPWRQASGKPTARLRQASGKPTAWLRQTSGKPAARLRRMSGRLRQGSGKGARARGLALAPMPGRGEDRRTANAVTHATGRAIAGFGVAAAAAWPGRLGGRAVSPRNRTVEIAGGAALLKACRGLAGRGVGRRLPPSRGGTRK